MARNTTPKTNRKSKSPSKALASPDKDDATTDDQLRLQPGTLSSPPFPLMKGPTSNTKPLALDAIGSPTSARSKRLSHRPSAFTANPTPPASTKPPTPSKAPDTNAAPPPSSKAGWEHSSSKDNPIDLSPPNGTPPDTNLKPASSPTSTQDSVEPYDDSTHFPVCRNLSPTTNHLNLTSQTQLDTYIDPRDGTTSKESIHYRQTLNFLQESTYQNAATHEDTRPADIPGYRPWVDQGFHRLDDQVFEREHYSKHYVNPLPDNATHNMHVQHNNALTFWLANLHTIVNDIGTLNTANTPSNHGERNLVNTIKTLDTQLNQLSTCTHEQLTPLLAFQPDRYNAKGNPLLTEPLAAELSSLRTDLNRIKRQLEPDKRTHPDSTAMTADDIKRIVLLSITNLLPAQETTAKSTLSHADLTDSVAATLAEHIQSIINNSIDNYHTHQTNALAIKDIADAPAVLARSVKLKAVITDHTKLEDQFAHLTKKIDAMLARQTLMDALLADPNTPTLANTKHHTPTILPTVTQPLPDSTMRERISDHPTQLNPQPDTTSLSASQQDNKRPASYQSYLPGSANQRNQRARYTDTISQEDTSSISSRPRQQYSPDQHNPTHYQDTHLHPYAKPKRQVPIQWHPAQNYITYL